jgi:hypothetical protein
VELEVKANNTSGVSLRTRYDGNLFDLRRLRARTKTTTFTTAELQYADDNGVMSHTEEGLQGLALCWDNAYQKFGTKVNYVKTKTLSQVYDGDVAHIQLNGALVDSVVKFPYLGSLFTANGSLDDEITSRIRAAHAAYGRLMSRVFRSHRLKLHTKLAVYQAVVLTTLLYGCETWTLYQYQVRLPERFHIGKLRSLLRIKWEDRISNVKILERTNMLSVEALVMKHRLRWSGHVQRMSDKSLPKSIFRGELCEGQRPVGGPKKRYKDQLKRDLKRIGLPPASFEAETVDRTSWRGRCSAGCQTWEEERRMHETSKRNATIQRAQDRALGLGPPPTHACDRCDRLFYSRLGLVSHKRTH